MRVGFNSAYVLTSNADLSAFEVWKDETRGAAHGEVMLRRLWCMLVVYLSSSFAIAENFRNQRGLNFK